MFWKKQTMVPEKFEDLEELKVETDIEVVKEIIPEETKKQKFDAAVQATLDRYVKKEIHDNMVEWVFGEEVVTQTREAMRIVKNKNDESTAPSVDAIMEKLPLANYGSVGNSYHRYNAFNLVITVDNILNKLVAEAQGK
jgi:hypothetical protein